MNVEHWQNIYQTKEDDQVSWTQSYPQLAIDHIRSLKLPLSARIIDVGGGTGNFVDALLDLEYTNISVLDISDSALTKSKARLGDRASSVTWINTDITTFTPEGTYDFWYDRAVFHFLTTKKDIDSYTEIASKSIEQGSNLLIGTFSKNGPLKCSGLEICQYSAESLKLIFSDSFHATHNFKHLHTTPFGTTQEFQFCGFLRK